LAVELASASTAAILAKSVFFAEKADELAPCHSITSPARPSSASGTVMPSTFGSLEVDHQLELGQLQHGQDG
jgi:hypothetical protein